MSWKEIFIGILTELRKTNRILEQAWLNKVTLDPTKTAPSEKKGIITQEDVTTTQPFARWSKEEIMKLVSLVNRGYATYPQLQKQLPGRTRASIQTKVCDLKKEGIIHKNIRVKYSI